MSDELRKEPRKDVEIALKLFSVKESSEKIDGQLKGVARDISIGGVGVELEIDSGNIWEILERFDTKTEDRLTVHLDVIHPAQSIEVVGTLAWCVATDKEAKRIRMGILLDKMETENLEKWQRFVSSV